MTNYSAMREVRDKQRKTRKERGGGVRDGAEGGAESVCVYKAEWVKHTQWGMPDKYS